MRNHFFSPCLGLIALLSTLFGCSGQTPSRPDALDTRGPDASSGATTRITTNSSRPPFVFPDGCCYYNGIIVRTVVPPAASPKDGRDNFYAITNGVAGQKGVVAVAPGAAGYH